MSGKQKQVSGQPHLPSWTRDSLNVSLDNKHVWMGEGNMTNTTEKRRINDLTAKEVNLIYSLMRNGDWPDLEIGRVYRLSEEDVTKGFDNYPELLDAAEKNPCLQDQPRQDPSQEGIGKPRKKRCDAQYATPAQRQSAYRARLGESRRARLEQPSPSNETDTPRPDDQRPSVTVCEAPIPEIGRENAETEHSACYDSSVERHDISESVPVSVMPGASSERKTLQKIEK